MALLENFLISRLVRYDAYAHPRLARAVNLINCNPGVRVSDVAGAACLGTRQFNRLFSSWAGTRPKDFIRIVRFQRALSILQKEPCTGLAQLAAACGYFDQAHMINEFREFSGYTPSRYLSLCEPYSDYFTGA